MNIILDEDLSLKVQFADKPQALKFKPYIIEIVFFTELGYSSLYFYETNQMKEFFEYKISNGDNDEYDYKSIVRDIWKEHGFPGKLETVAIVMQFSDGKLNQKLVIETFNEVKNENPE